MLSQILKCLDIDVPKVDASKRSFSKEFSRNLAQSIQMEGMHQPIVVRPNPAKPGRYVLVIGRHRLYAVHKVLRLESIEARVIPDMDEVDVEMATISENLWRNPLKKAQHLRAIQVWHEHYATKYPEKVGRGAGSAAAAEARKRKKEEAAEVARLAAETGVGSDPGPGNPPVPADPAAEPPVPAPADPAPAPSGGFTGLVANTTGQGETATKEDIKLAKTFSAEQLEIFDQMQVPKGDMLRIAKLKNADQRAEIANLILSGMDIDEAILRVTKPDAATTTAEAATAQAEAAEDNLTDTEWLDTCCGSFRKLLPEPTRSRFDIAALFYRATREARNAFRAKTKKARGAIVKSSRSAFVRAVFRVTGTSHPKHWLRCGDCNGTGSAPGGAGGIHPCRTCYGDGFLEQVEGR